MVADDPVHGRRELTDRRLYHRQEDSRGHHLHAEPVDETLHRLQHREAQAGQERFREGLLQADE